MPDDRQPNIIVIYPDQMRYDAMSPAGNGFVKTPNLQRLADEGVVFDNAYTSYPLCCPFRASLMTGKYAHGHGMFQNHLPLDGDQQFLAQLLKDAGHQTGYVGKWHLEGGPKPGYVPPERRFGFDFFVGFNRGHQYLDGVFFRETDQPYHCKRYEPDFQTDHLIEFIDGAVEKNPDQPFFGFVSYGPPHHPNDMPEYWRKMYDPQDVPLPPGTPDPDTQVAVQKQRLEIDCLGIEKAALASRCSHGKKKPLEPEHEAELREFIAEYYAMISNIDFNVGRILNRLDALGIAEDTMVILLSDHGDMLGQHGYYCGTKRTAYRASMQVPLIIRYPRRFQAGWRTNAMVDVGPDTMVTLLDLAGVAAPQEAHGQSYLPVLDGTNDHGRDAIMYQTFKTEDGARGEFTPMPERGIRTRDWLYVRQPDRRKLLIDQRNDPEELNNLVDDPSLGSLMDDFDTVITRHMAETGDAWNLKKEFPPPGFLTHKEAKDLLVNELLPRAIVVP